MLFNAMAFNADVQILHEKCLFYRQVSCIFALKLPE
jgi:hypothetical protein